MSAKPGSRSYSLLNCSPSRVLFAPLLLTLFAIIFWSAHRISGSQLSWSQLRPSYFDSKDSSPAPTVNFTKPEGVKIIGLVFYGRKEFVSILDCYLKRNLVDNGGLMDEVIFAVKTEIQEDLDYLEELLESSPLYKKHVAATNYDSWLMGSWEGVGGDDIYIKIDDDVVFFEDGTIAAVADRLLSRPEYFAVSANVVNNPALSWVHYSLGVYDPPYLPEIDPPPPESLPASPSWRASDLPEWSGPSDFHIDGSVPPPYEGHRWLPLAKGVDVDKTPISAITYDAYGPGLMDWTIAAQTHYTFLHHLTYSDPGLNAYKLHGAVWDYHYGRLSINFFAVRGRDIADAFPFPDGDDERYLTEERPKELGRHVVVEGSGVAVHFAFGPQRRAHEDRGVFWTDALSRYRAYAEEMVCPRDHRAVDTKERF